MQDIQDHLLPDEKLSWRGKPDHAAFLGNRIPMLIFLSLVVGFFVVGFFVTMFGVTLALDGADGLTTIVLPTLFLAFAILFPLFLMLAEKSYQITEYSITNKRLISTWGAFSKNTLAIPKHQIMQTQVSVSTADALFAGGTTGSIFFTLNMMQPVHHSGGQGVAYTSYTPMQITFANVENPQQVLNIALENPEKPASQKA